MDGRRDNYVAYCVFNTMAAGHGVCQFCPSRLDDNVFP